MAQILTKFQIPGGGSGRYTDAAMRYLKNHRMCMYVTYYWNGRVSGPSLIVKNRTWAPLIAHHSLKLAAWEESMMASSI